MSPAGEGQKEEDTLALGMRHGPDLKGVQSGDTPSPRAVIRARAQPDYR